MQLWVQTPKEKTSQKKGTAYVSHNHWKLEIYLCFVITVAITISFLPPSSCGCCSCLALI
jgi:hypothetical protein